MTFILNVLNDDYSLLAADRQADAVGPTTISVGKMTIFAENGLTIDGFRKMKISKCGSIAVGISGAVDDHRYFADFEEVSGVQSSIEAILTSAKDFFASDDRDGNLSARTMMENQGVATFFDQAALRYFSLFYAYTHRDMYSRWYRAAGSARLVHAGTGSTKFQEAVGLDQINAFIESINGNADPRSCIEWLEGAFQKVSEVAKGVGREPEFLISSRSFPAFRTLERS